MTQDLRTGELAYRPIQATTLRIPNPMLRIGSGSQSIVATAGHPFWVEGHGSRPAKFLHIGDRLHSVDGAVVVDEIQEVRASEAYNLILSERHNYFVGPSCLLVHDNSPSLEESVTVPGLAAAAQ